MMKGATVAGCRVNSVVRQCLAQAFHAQDILPGMKAAHKHINPKYFYDQRGSRLFELITQTPEYYVTRAETEIFQTYAEEIAELVGRNCILIEPGSGNCEKVEHLLPTLRPAAYMPTDIAAMQLRQAVLRLGQKFPWLHCMPLAAEFDQIGNLPVTLSPMRRIVFFPGSTIGNFDPEDAIDFLRTVRRIVDVEGGLLIGVDLEKDRSTLELAYNDAAGITEMFNLNILHHVNALTGSDFDTSDFRHVALYNTQRRRIEMYLRSVCDLDVSMGDEIIHFRAGECLHTENSYKYSTAAFSALAVEANFVRARTWYDRDRLFALHYFVAA